MNIGRVVTAMVTPFNEKGQIDFPQIKVLLDYLIANGTDAVVVGGTTGESATLSLEEKEALYAESVRAAAGRIPVIAGTGMNDTHATAELTIRAEKANVDGIMLVAPYYNKPSQQGLYEHFKTIAGKTSLDVMLYNVPGRTMVNMLPETVIALSQIKNITSVKEASGNLDQMTAIISNTPDDFTVYTGEDSLTLPSMAIGATGVVSVASHVIGSHMQDMIARYLKGDIHGASSIHGRIVPLMKAMFIAPSPSPVKAALAFQGINSGGVRLPLIPLTEEEKTIVQKALETIHSPFKQ
ncbi:4-hydroxy-tetrahydrodipicolinate synthase [Paenalkalicoccus suaedae]|uniref:4-hydroxy-tetrahydrodipicolinate synthase n=1 Tax=Paenalkalicoccus suaedae TaxID=2592382 RepID=A0A859FEL8_9BACI|nr:4-hydroxy-tetrahydrodipicolinate synthase [Paenalkalicoccus suaedae]QKS71381.1 4-hydroxy-tetrahydrodipicolinate synthase [Paenalkalicoccus suaedae]